MEEIVAAIIGDGIVLLIAVVSYAVRLEVRLSRLDSRLVQTGDIDLKEAPNARELLDTPPGMNRVRAVVHRKFDVPFSRQPKVIAGLTMIDLDDPSGANIHRISVSPTNVTLVGFDLCFETWNKSRVYNATASWVAIIPTST
jgi:hypothetical protein